MMTLSISTLKMMTFNIMTKVRYSACDMYTFTVVLSVIKQSVVMLSVVKQNVFMLSVVMLSVIMLSVVKQCVVMLSVVKQSVIMLSDVKKSVIMLSVFGTTFFYLIFVLALLISYLI